MVRAFAHGAMGRRIDPSWGEPIELFLVPASVPRLVYQRPWYVLSCLWDGAYCDGNLFWPLSNASRGTLIRPLADYQPLTIDCSATNLAVIVSIRLCLLSPVKGHHILIRLSLN